MLINFKSYGTITSAEIRQVIFYIEAPKLMKMKTCSAPLLLFASGTVFM